MNVTTPDVAVDGVTKSFGTTRAVDAVDLQIAGGVVGVLGPNGAGKTTLLRMLATVLAPDDGAVRLLGLDPRRAPERLAIRHQLGYLPQEPGLYQGFTAFDLVEYVAVLKQMTDRVTRRDEVRRVLGLVDLIDVMHKKIRALSGGTRQRVALAAAMLGDPHLLVLDEPAAGLDPEHRLQLRSVLSAAGRDGTVIVSTHQTDEVAAFCRQVVVMVAGRIRFVGSPTRLAAVAAGHVWIDDGDRAALTPPGSVQSWITSDGHVRHLGEPPRAAELVDPTIDDGYLFLTNAEMSLR